MSGKLYPGMPAVRPELEQQLRELREERETPREGREMSLEEKLAASIAREANAPGADRCPAEDAFPKFIRVDYRDFVRTLAGAYYQTAYGKGNARHGGADVAWVDQPIMAETRQMGTAAGPIFQARKKLLESLRLPPERAAAEVLGAIVYAVAAHHYFTQRANERPKEDR